MARHRTGSFAVPWHPVRQMLGLDGDLVLKFPPLPFNGGASMEKQKARDLSVARLGVTVRG